MLGNQALLVTSAALVSVAALGTPLGCLQLCSQVASPSAQLCQALATPPWAGRVLKALVKAVVGPLPLAIAGQAQTTVAAGTNTRRRL